MSVNYDSEVWWIPDDVDVWTLATKSSGLLPNGCVNFTVHRSKKLVALPLEKCLRASKEPGNQEDLTLLPDVNQATILACVRTRFQEQRIYTSMGMVLMSVNPFRVIPGLYGKNVIKQYEDPFVKNLPAHVYLVPGRAYRNMASSGRNQSILISGESGAGKTEATKQCLSYLTEAAGLTFPTTSGRASINMGRASIHMKRASATFVTMNDISDRIIAASPILEAFGNAKTVRNPNSSRFGKWMVLNFDRNNVILSSNIISYLLEKSRITQRDSKERNYHVFYQILRGMEPELLQQWNVNRSTTCHRYLCANDHEDEAPDFDDARLYKDTYQAFLRMGFTRDEIIHIFKIVLAVLQLGDIIFQSVRDGEGTEIVNSFVTEQVAKKLGISTDIMTQTLLNRSFEAGKKSITMIGLKIQQAKDARDSLARAIYERLFQDIINSINSKSKGNESRNDVQGFDRSIGLLDIFGFEIFVENSFEQLCINYCNEMLQNHFNYIIFTSEKALYDREGIVCDTIEFRDNSGVIREIEGLFKALDEETRIPKGSSKTWFEKLKKGTRMQNISFPTKKTGDFFQVKHYAGNVDYSPVGFMEKNIETLHHDLVGTLSASTDPLINKLFNINPENEGSGDSSQPPPPPPPTKQRSTTALLANKSISWRFTSQLGKLMNILKQTDSHFIRCIKSNDECAPQKVDSTIVHKQLIYSGVFEVVKIQQSGLPCRLSHFDYLERFKCLIKSNIRYSIRTSNELLHYLIKDGYDLKESKIGVNMVFYKSFEQRLLEGKRDDLLNKSSTMMSRWLMMITRKYAYRNIIEHHRNFSYYNEELDLTNATTAYEKFKEYTAYLHELDGYPVLSHVIFRMEKELSLLDRRVQLIEDTKNVLQNRSTYGVAGFEEIVGRAMELEITDHRLVKQCRETIKNYYQAVEFVSIVRRTNTIEGRRISFRKASMSGSHTLSTLSYDQINDGIQLLQQFQDLVEYATDSATEASVYATDVKREIETFVNPLKSYLHQASLEFDPTTGELIFKYHERGKESYMQVKEIISTMQPESFKSKDISLVYEDATIFIKLMEDCVDCNDAQSAILMMNTMSRFKEENSIFVTQIEELQKWAEIQISPQTLRDLVTKGYVMNSAIQEHPVHFEEIDKLLDKLRGISHPSITILNVIKAGEWIVKLRKSFLARDWDELEDIVVRADQDGVDNFIFDDVPECIDELNSCQWQVIYNGFLGDILFSIAEPIFRSITMDAETWIDLVADVKEDLGMIEDIRQFADESNSPKLLKVLPILEKLLHLRTCVYSFEMEIAKTIIQDILAQQPVLIEFDLKTAVTEEIESCRKLIAKTENEKKLDEILADIPQIYFIDEVVAANSSTTVIPTSSTTTTSTVTATTTTKTVTTKTADSKPHLAINVPPPPPQPLGSPGKSPSTKYGVATAITAATTVAAAAAALGNKSSNKVSPNKDSTGKSSANSTLNATTSATKKSPTSTATTTTTANDSTASQSLLVNQQSKFCTRNNLATSIVNLQDVLTAFQGLASNFNVDLQDKLKVASVILSGRRYLQMSEDDLTTTNSNASAMHMNTPGHHKTTWKDYWKSYDSGIQSLMEELNNRELIYKYQEEMQIVIFEMKRRYIIHGLFHILGTPVILGNVDVNVYVDDAILIETFHQFNDFSAVIKEPHYEIKLPAYLLPIEDHIIEKEEGDSEDIDEIITSSHVYNFNSKHKIPEAIKQYPESVFVLAKFVRYTSQLRKLTSKIPWDEVQIKHLIKYVRNIAHGGGMNIVNIPREMKLLEDEIHCRECVRSLMKELEKIQISFNHEISSSIGNTPITGGSTNSIIINPTSSFTITQDILQTLEDVHIVVNLKPLREATTSATKYIGDKTKKLVRLAESVIAIMEILVRNEVDKIVPEKMEAIAKEYASLALNSFNVEKVFDRVRMYNFLKSLGGILGTYRDSAEELVRHINKLRQSMKFLPEKFFPWLRAAYLFSAIADAIQQNDWIHITAMSNQLGEYIECELQQALKELQHSDFQLGKSLSDAAKFIQHCTTQQALGYERAIVLKHQQDEAEEIEKVSNFTPTDALKVQIRNEDFQKNPYGVGHLRKAGYSDQEITGLKTFPARVLWAYNFEPRLLRRNGYPAKALLQAGYPLVDTYRAGYSPRHLYVAGVSIAEMRSLGITLTQMRQSAGIPVEQLMSSRAIPLIELKEVEFHPRKLHEWGFSLAELVEAGCTATELRGAGFNAMQIFDAGLQEIEEFVEAKFPLEPLTNLFPLYVLRATGHYSFIEFKKAGLTDEELLNAGFFVEVERDALKCLFQATDGKNWRLKTNWNSPGVTSYQTWHGITIELDQMERPRVVAIDLVNNNLSGQIPKELAYLKKLKRLRMGLNNIKGSIPDGLLALIVLNHITTDLIIENGQILDVMSSNNNNGNSSVFDNNNNDAMSVTTNNPILLSSRNSITRPLIRKNSFVNDPNAPRYTTPTAAANSRWESKVDANDISPLQMLNLRASINNPRSSNNSTMNSLINMNSPMNNIINNKKFNPPQTPSGLTSPQAATTTNLNPHTFSFSSQRIQSSTDNALTNNMNNMSSISMLRSPTANNNNMMQNDDNSVLQSEEQYLDEENRAILVEFYQSLRGRKWTKHDNWATSAPVRDWFGVTVNKRGFVTAIVLPSNNLRGCLPNSINRLSKLEMLDLRLNQIGGVIPDTIEECVSLKNVYLQMNKLCGSIPNAFHFMNQLVVLDLRSNLLQGDLPYSVYQLKHLRYLGLRSNQFNSVNVNGLTSNMPLCKIVA